MDDEVTSIVKEMKGNENNYGKQSASAEKIYNEMVKMYMKEEENR